MRGGDGRPWGQAKGHGETSDPREGLTTQRAPPTRGVNVLDVTIDCSVCDVNLVYLKAEWFENLTHKKDLIRANRNKKSINRSLGIFPTGDGPSALPDALGIHYCTHGNKVWKTEMLIEENFVNWLIRTRAQTLGKPRAPYADKGNCQILWHSPVNRLGLRPCFPTPCMRRIYSPRIPWLFMFIHAIIMASLYNKRTF